MYPEGGHAYVCGTNWYLSDEYGDYYDRKACVDVYTNPDACIVVEEGRDAGGDPYANRVCTFDYTI